MISDSFEAAARALLALALIASTAVVAHRAGWWLVGPRRIALRFAAVAMAGMGLATAAFHLLRPLGLFRIEVAVPGAVLLAVGALSTKARRVRARRALDADLRSVRRVVRAHRRSRFRGLTTVFALLIAFVVLRSLILPPLGWDTVTYHGPRAALWVQTGANSFEPGPGPWSLYRDFFAGAEVLFAWVMLPFRSDLFVCFASALQWLVSGLAFWALGRALGLREPWSSLSAVAGLFLPPLQLTVSSGYSEPALFAALFTGYAAGCEHLRSPRPRLLLLVGLALGLAAGMKPQGAVPAAVMMGILVLRVVTDSRQRRSAWPFLLGGALAMVVPVVPWMIQAVQHTGYPLSPIPARPLGLMLGIADPAMAWYLNRPEVTPYEFQSELGALLQIFVLPGTSTREALGALTLIPLTLMPFGLLQLARRNAWLATTVVLAIAAVVAFYFSRGLAVSRLLWAMSVSRYVATAVLLALPVSVLAVAPTRLARWYQGALVIITGYNALFYFRFGWAGYEAPAIFAVVLALVALVVLVLVVRRHAGARLTIVVGSLLGLVFSGALQVAKDALRSEALQDSVVLHRTPRYWADAATAVDEPAAPQLIAMTSGPWQNADNWFTYFFLGRRFQNQMTYVPISADARVVPFGSTSELAGAADETAWLRRIHDRGVTAVMAFEPASLELEWMARHPERFVRVSGGASWGLFSVRP